MEPRDRVATEVTDAAAPSATSPLRLTAYAIFLAVVAFAQQPGKLVADTKFDLFVDPGRFLSQSLRMWDSVGALGQIQNQAYGYLFPMGPFFWLGDASPVPMWVWQRLWWTALLCAAFFGIVLLTRALRIGVPWTQVVAGFAYALAAHVTTIIGGSSVEAWPTALAPWVLYCLVRATNTLYPRRWAAAAALVTVACGGVNAVAVSVVLPAGLWWLATRPRHSGAWRVLFWWVLCTVLATLWWVVPLFLLGAYSVPFLDYIESASITTAPTSLVDVLHGTSDWVAYVDPRTFGAGHMLATNGFLVVNAAVIATMGLVGLARRDMPQRVFLILTLLTGLALLTFGYTGDGAGWAADQRQELLDGALAPLRNLHKYDALIRIPLVLGIAHLLGRASRVRDLPALRIWIPVLVLAVLGLSTPWLVGSVAPAGPVSAVPSYWTRTADFLDNTSKGGRTLVLPAAAFGTYTWGSPRDDIMQPLMTTPWAVRNVIPLANPGNVSFLDEVTDAVESGAPTPDLARVLAANGVDRLVVRNDLDRLASGAPDPIVLRATLSKTPGLSRERGFGPWLGTPRVRVVDGARVVNDGGLGGRYRAVDVYRVQQPAPRAALFDAEDVPVRVGSPGAELRGAGEPGPWLLSEDVPRGSKSYEPARTQLTDGLQRREESFSAVRRHVSSTMTQDQPWRTSRPEHFRRLAPDEEHWQATERWSGGVASVTASSSQAWVDTAGSMRRDAAPGAALDGETETSWRSSPVLGTTEPWWEVHLSHDTEVDTLSIRLGPSSPISSLRISDGDRSTTIKDPPTDRAFDVSADLGSTDRVRITAAFRDPATAGQVASLAEVRVPGIQPRRSVALPKPAGDAPVSEIDLSRDPGTSACIARRSVDVCHDALAIGGDDGATIDRSLDLPASAEYAASVRGSWRDGPDAAARLALGLPYDVTVSSTQTNDLRGSALALADGSPRTSWIAAADDERPRITLSWPRATTVSKLAVRLRPRAPAVRPQQLELSAGGETRRVSVGDDGRARFRPLTGRKLTIRVLSAAEGYDGFVSDDTRLPVGIASLILRHGSSPDLLRLDPRQMDHRCGSGPTLHLGGSALRTRVTVDRSSPLAAPPQLTLCDDRVRLPAGEQEVVATPTPDVTVDQITLRTGSTAATPASEAPDIDQWSDQHRELTVPASPSARLLVVPENYNAGWRATLDGHELDAQRVEGWKQGWWLPADAEGKVVLTYAPAPIYTSALIAGLVGLLLVVALALIPHRRTGRRAAVLTDQAPADARFSEPVLLAAAVGVMGLAAGWPGAAFAIGAWLLARLLRPPWYVVGGLAGALVLAAGVWTAWDRSQADTLTSRSATQYLVAAGISVAVFAGSRGMRFFKRRNGRSTT